MISAPFELTVFQRSGPVQVRQFEQLATAMAAIASLKPSLYCGYHLAVVIASATFKEAWRDRDGVREPVRFPRLAPHV
jgi:hypothetical protein